jgi:4-amino-4-deoxy-L-arabinose transferase-like glycosyltransferase
MLENSPTMNSKLSGSRRYLLLFIFSLAYLYLFVRVLWRIGDEGTLVYGAQLVTQGAVPYRDFCEVMGPGSFYWLGLFFKLFGTNIVVARGLLLVTAALTIILLYWMTRRLYRGPFDILPSLFFLVIGLPLWPGTNHHWDSDFFGLLAVGALFLWQERRRWWFLALAGVLAGLTSCFIQQKGLFLIVAFALVILVNGYQSGEAKPQILSRVGLVLAGFAAVGCLVLGFFYFSGALSDLIYANLIWPLTSYSKVNVCPYGFGLMELCFPSYYKILRDLFPFPLNQIVAGLILIPFLVIFFLPLLLLGLAGISCLQKANWGKIFNATMLPYWAAGGALWISELHRKDILHLIYGSPLLLILLFVVANYCLENKNRLKVLLVSLLSISLIIFGSFDALIALSANQKIVTRRGILYGFKDDPALKFLIEHTKPGDYAFIYPYYPMYYFLADVTNPTRYFTLISHFHTEAQFKDAIENLERQHVKYVLWDTAVAGSKLKTWFPQYKQPSEENLLLERYLKEHYQVIGLKNGFRILRRKEDKLAN